MLRGYAGFSNKNALNGLKTANGRKDRFLSFAAAD